MKHLRLTGAAFAVLFYCLPASAQNAGTVTSHAFAVGKGPGVQGFSSVPCTSAQLALGQTSADPSCKTITGDVTFTALGVTAIGANKVTNAQIRQSGALALVGRSANSAGNVADIQATAGSSCAFVETSSTLACAQIQTNGIANGAVTNAKISQVPALTIKGNSSGSPGVQQDIDITSLPLKSSPITGDLLLIQDSASGNAMKKTTVGALASAGSVGSFNGRTGAVVPVNTDYPPTLIGAVAVVTQQSFCPSGCTTGVASGSSGTYTPRTGLLYAVIECQGPSGGSGGAAGASGFVVGGGGGGGGGWSRKTVSAATLGASQTVTLGAVGAAGSAGAGAGGAAGDTSLGTLCVGKGGSGGTGGSSGAVGGGGAGGVAGTGDITIPGGNGGSGFYSTAIGPRGLGGLGGESRFGASGQPLAVVSGASTAGASGSGFGGGPAGGAANNVASNVTGAAGQPSIVVVTEYSPQ